MTSQRSARMEAVHDTTLATLDEQSHCQVGPKNLFDRPAQDPPVPSSNKIPRGAVTRGDENRADERGGAAVRRNFSIVVGRQVLMVREQRSKRDAMAAQPAAWESVHGTTEMR